MRPCGVSCVIYTLMGGLLLGLIPSGFAEQPVASKKDGIDFSDLELPRGLVPSGHDPLSRAGRFESLPRGGSMGGVIEKLPPPPSGSALQTPSARLLELMEQRRNWIQTTEPSSSLGNSVEQSMGIRSYNLTEAAGGQGFLGGILQGSNPSVQPAAPVNPLFDQRRDGLLFDSYRLDDLSGTGRLPDSRSRTEIGNFGQGNLDLLGVQSLQGLGNRTDTALTETTREGSAMGMGSIRDLLRSPENVSPLARPFDPIDFRIDTTRQELNPINPQRPVERASDRSLADFFGPSGLGSGGTAGSAVSGILDRVAADGQRASSLAPVVRAPERGVQPIKQFGEFPTRPF
jgi:hypothetical protein